MIAEEAFGLLYPEKSGEYIISLRYSGKFRPYNANVKYSHSKKNIDFNLSKKWKTVSKEIQIGLIQSLLVKIFRDKKQTMNTDLYNKFMKNIHMAAPKTKTDPVLEESFSRVNERYFYGLIEKPNLSWHKSISKLGSYEYGSDTISISKVLLNHEKDILDYIMHHEMLHKKYKFKSKNGRNFHHTTEFRTKEKEFDNSERIERELKKIAGRRNFSFFMHKNRKLWV